MKSVSKIALLIGLLATLLPFVAGQGCPTTPAVVPTETGSIDSDGDDLTDAEKRAIAAACNAPGTITQATGVCEDAMGDLSGGSAQEIPPGEPGSRDVSFGTCPTVTKTGSLASDNLSLTIDFGSQPCTAFTLEDGTTYLCSGLASGSFGRVSKSLSLEFADIICDDQKLDGFATLGWKLGITGVEFTGDWDLLWTIGSDVLGTRGNGRAGYERVLEGCCDTTSIDEFTGELTDGPCVWSIAMAALKVSLLKYSSLIPYSGYMTLDGPDIRPMTITFSENSPTLGEIVVTVTPGRTMTVNLYELEEWLAMYPVE